MTLNLRNLPRYPYTLIIGTILVVSAVAVCSIAGRLGFSLTSPAAKHLWQGHSIYGHNDGYIYPPFPALVALPFSFFPQSIDHLLWFLVSAASLCLVMRWSWTISGGKQLEGENILNPRENLIFLLGLFPGFLYGLNCLSHSQTDLLIDFAVVGGCLAVIKKTKPSSPPPLSASPGAMKGPALLFLPYLIYRGRFASAVWMIFIFISANLLPNFIARVEIKSSSL